MTEYDKTHSRKWKLVLLVVWLATVGTFLPPMISSWLFGAINPLAIVSGTEYISVITLVVSAYFGANVFQRHLTEKSISVDLGARLNSNVKNEEGET